MRTRPLRFTLVPATDAVIWILAIIFAALLRLDFDTQRLEWSAIATAGLISVVIQLIAGLGLGLYLGRWRYGSFDETVGLAGSAILTGSVLQIVVLAQVLIGIPRTVPMIGTGLFITGAVGLRAVWRLVRQSVNKPTTATPLIVIGAGEAAYVIVQRLLTNPKSPYRPVAILDDDPAKKRSRLHGVRVHGHLSDLPDMAKALGVTQVLFAIPSASREVLMAVHNDCMRSNLHLLVLPSASDLFTDPQVSDIRSVTEIDLLGRREVTIDRESIRSFISGKKVLVTGAGGSIGSELCRQISRFAPSELIMLDRDESGLHSVQLSIEGQALLDSPNLVLADIRDHDRLQTVFEVFKPEIVFHAAALKHLPLLEMAPDEAWKTNVVGTNNVLEAAQSNGVRHFVNISTDKAANPTSVLGYSKRLTERLTSHRDSVSDGSFISVRFGNVLGSRGSVLTAFRAQAAAGGPITVTHPDVTRYFMTVEEAVGLTLVAATIGEGGEILILDMGEPVNIADVARRFAQQHNPPLEIVFTGLRPGEKLHEDLFSNAESAESKVHPLISHADVPPLSMEQLQCLSNGSEVDSPALLQSACSIGMKESAKTRL